MTGWKIPLFDTTFGEEEMDAVLRPLKAGWLTMGDEVVQLEAELRDMTGAAHAIAVSSATSALQLAGAALGLGPGDEVLCPTLTMVATANAPRSLGARITLCDSVGEHDLNIDPAALSAAITDDTAAIFVVHYAGFACDMDAILDVAGESGIPVIEDASHALFTTHNNKTVGLYGDVGCFSFYSNKNATCGEGGAVITNDAGLAHQIRLLRSHGMTTPTLDRHRGMATTYDVVVPGFNARMDEIRAALLRVQLGRLPGFLQQRRQLFREYVEALDGTRIQVPFSTGRYAEELDETAVHIMAVLLPSGVDRSDVMAGLKALGIQTSIHYPPIHRFGPYLGQSGLQRTAALADRQLTLPLFPAMTSSDVATVTRGLVALVEGR